jgi:pantoate--beta-alanine ligase
VARTLYHLPNLTPLIVAVNAAKSKATHIQARCSLQTLHRVFELKDRLNLLRTGGASVALVPTMGALHSGHMKLIEAAQAQAEHVVVSIFVNPRQFGPKEDFGAYPRPEKADAELLEQAGVDLLWMPSVAEMYPPGYATTVSVADLGDRLCGAARPGHFDGVATVVAKLFTQVHPDKALFGEKDWQQLAIIRRMAKDLDLGVDVIGVPTVRDSDGLALSSRNAYLSAAERTHAAALPQALLAAKIAIEAGEDVADSLAQASAAIISAGFETPDYVALMGADDLEPMPHLDRPARILAAARLGKARLIDNMAVGL